MVIRVEKQAYKLDGLFLGLIVVILAAGIGGNYYFSTQPLLLRVIVSLVLAAIGIFLAAKTNAGGKALISWQEALTEVRKIVWPTKKETIQATLGVLAMVLVMGLILWTIDSILLRGIAWILGH